MSKYPVLDSAWEEFCKQQNEARKLRNEGAESFGKAGDLCDLAGASHSLAVRSFYRGKVKYAHDGKMLAETRKLDVLGQWHEALAAEREAKASEVKAVGNGIIAMGEMQGAKAEETWINAVVATLGNVSIKYTPDGGCILDETIIFAPPH
jgi:hypothetical protein